MYKPVLSNQLKFPFMDPAWTPPAPPDPPPEVVYTPHPRVAVVRDGKEFVLMVRSDDAPWSFGAGHAMAWWVRKERACQYADAVARSPELLRRARGRQDWLEAVGEAVERGAR